MPDDFRWLEPLETSGWSTQERADLEELATLLDQHDAARIDQHVALTHRLPSGVVDFEHFIEPAIFSLLGYGEKGIAALAQLAVGQFKEASVAQRALLVVAQRRRDLALRAIALAHRYLPRDTFKRLADRVEATFGDDALRAAAQREFGRYVYEAINQRELRHRLSMLLSTSSLYFGGQQVEDIVLESVARASLRLTDEICDEFEALIREDLPEAKYQEFLEQHPAIVDPLASQIVARKHLAEVWKTDFVIRRLDDEYIFVEIEKPRDRPISTYPAPMAPLTHAVAQVVNWFVWVEDNIAYAQTHGFPRIHQPRGVVIIGRSADLTAEQQRHFRAYNDLLGGRIRIMTFDDLLASARNVVANMVKRLGEQLPE